MDIGQADRLTALGIRFHVRFDGYVEQSGDLMHIDKVVTIGEDSEGV